MKSTLYIVITFLLIVFLGCNQSTDPTLAVNTENSSDQMTLMKKSTYATKGSIHEGLDWDFEPFGEISGDIIGVTSLEWVGDAFPHGHSWTEYIVRTMEVTGGNVPELIGKTLEFDGTITGVWYENNPYVTKAKETLRIDTIIDNLVIKGNLTVHGYVYWYTEDYFLDVYLDYHGAIQVSEVD
jgi:hypothetical protein